MFPTEKLVYLSPDSDVELKEVDKEKIYVLGGIVDHNRLKVRIVKLNVSFLLGWLGACE